MARCGCTSNCNCAVSEQDTQSVDMSVTGNGAAGTPYVIQADVRLVPDTEGPLSPAGVNPLKEVTEGLYVDVGALGAMPEFLTITAEIGTTYDPVLADINTLITLDNASPITLTMPQDTDVAFPIGSQVHFAQIGAGQVEVVAGTGAVVNATPGLFFRAQYSTITAIKRAANTWLLVGDLDV